MPELPEVETIRRQLAPLVEGRRLLRVQILDPRWCDPLQPHELAAALEGRRVQALGRRGKYLVWQLHGDVHLVQHLRMTGAVLCDPRPEPTHARVRIELGSRRAGLAVAGPVRAPAGPVRAPAGSARATAGPTLAANSSPRAADGADAAGANPRRRRLVITDPRRFGTGQLVLGAEALDAFFDRRLGLEPLDERFTAEHLRALARGRSTPIKALLLDQRRIAGIGNIYADEALHRAGIHPLRPAGRLTLAQCARLRDAVVEALLDGIDARGATIEDFRHVDGVRGSFQDRFRVYGRTGEPCPTCGTPITRLLVAGRGTHVCERCQPRPRARASR